MKHVGLPWFFYQKPANEMFWYISHKLPVERYVHISSDLTQLTQPHKIGNYSASATKCKQESDHQNWLTHNKCNARLIFRWINNYIVVENANI